MKWRPLCKSTLVLLRYDYKIATQKNFKIFLKPIDVAVIFSGYVIKQAVYLRATLDCSETLTLTLTALTIFVASPATSKGKLGDGYLRYQNRQLAT